MNLDCCAHMIAQLNILLKQSILLTFCSANCSTGSGASQLSIEMSVLLPVHKYMYTGSARKGKPLLPWQIDMATYLPRLKRSWLWTNKIHFSIKYTVEWSQLNTYLHTRHISVKKLSLRTSLENYITGWLLLPVGEKNLMSWTPLANF